MPEELLPENVRNFVLAKIPTVLQLEALLHLRAAYPRFLAVAEVARPLGLDDATAREQLRELQSCGLARAETIAESAFAYTSESPEQDRTVHDLADAYRTRRVSVINAICAGPVERIRTFADAFRLRSQKETPP